MGRISRADLLDRRFTAIREVTVPGRDGTLLMREMTAKERDAFEAEMFTNAITYDADGKQVTTRTLNEDNFRARLVARCLVDDEGNRYFGDDEAEQLGTVGAGTVNALFAVAQEMNGFGPAGKDAAEKNSPAPSADSPSVSA